MIQKLSWYARDRVSANAKKIHWIFLTFQHGSYWEQEKKKKCKENNNNNDSKRADIKTKINRTIDKQHFLLLSYFWLILFVVITISITMYQRICWCWPWIPLWLSWFRRRKGVHWSASSNNWCPLCIIFLGCCCPLLIFNKIDTAKISTTGSKKDVDGGRTQYIFDY